MSDPGGETFLSIGAFARLSGLSVGALRYYDERGIITPAERRAVLARHRQRLDAQALKALAASWLNRVWELLEQGDRAPIER